MATKPKAKPKPKPGDAYQPDNRTILAAAKAALARFKGK